MLNINTKINTKKNIGIHSYIFILFIVSVFIGPCLVSAATINLSPSDGSYNVGDTIRVRVSVGTNTSINATSGKVSFPNDKLTLTSMSKAGSIVSLWAQEPSYSNTSGTASFEGVILNGYTGTSGTIITMIFKAKASGVANISFSQASVLANDGNGTEVVTGKGTAQFSIGAGQIKTEDKPQAPVRNTVIKIEEVKSTTDDLAKKFLITTPLPVKDNSYSVSIDSQSVITWVDDGTHIFQAPELDTGVHNIKISAKSTSGDELRGYIEFSTTVVTLPVMIDYPTEMFVNDFMVIKGTAGPEVYVELSVTNVSTSEVITSRTEVNKEGKWIYVSDTKMKKGSYTVVAKAINKDGLESGYTSPVKIIVKENIFNKLMSQINSYLMIVAPVLLLLLAMIVMIIYSIYHIKKLRLSLKKKLKRTEGLVEKSFEVLEEELDDEIAIFKKIKAQKLLNPNERPFLTKFKADIETAEKVILKEIKDPKK